MSRGPPSGSGMRPPAIDVAHQQRPKLRPRGIDASGVPVRLRPRGVDLNGGRGIARRPLLGE